MDFRKEIVRELKRRKMSAYRLAKDAGMPPRGVQKFLVADRDMSSQRLAAVLKVLGFKLVRPPKRKG